MPSRPDAISERERAAHLPSDLRGHAAIAFYSGGFGEVEPVRIARAEGAVRARGAILRGSVTSCGDPDGKLDVEALSLGAARPGISCINDDTRGLFRRAIAAGRRQTGPPPTDML